MRQRESRERQKKMKETIVTPPQTPDRQDPMLEDVTESRQRMQGEVTRARNRSRMNYEMKTLHRKLDHKQRESSKYHTRWQRLMISNMDSPRSKTKKLRRFATSTDVR